MRKILFISIIVVTIYSCKKEKADPVPAPVVSVPACDSTITYTNKVKKILDDNCINCHVAGFICNGSNCDYTTFAGIKAKADNGKLNQRVVVERSMPSDHQLSDADIHTIDCWIKTGAKQ